MWTEAIVALLLHGAATRAALDPYAVNMSYAPSDFFDKSLFSLFSGADPTNGKVKYLGWDRATDNDQSHSLAQKYDHYAFFGASNLDTVPPEGRPSVRLESLSTFTGGLFIADLAHVPSSAPGIWPAFWTFGDSQSQWPNQGEIDIYEGVNFQKVNKVTLHTSPGCFLTNTMSKTTTLVSPDCGGGGGFSGCSQSTQAPFGDPMNDAGGGVYAMEWTLKYINVYWIPRGKIPDDIMKGAPTPESWSTFLLASFTPDTGSGGCDIAKHFFQHKIVFNITFCGDWAGKTYGNDPDCPKDTCPQDCAAYVMGAHGKAYDGAYFAINSMAVYSSASRYTSGSV